MHNHSFLTGIQFRQMQCLKEEYQIQDSQREPEIRTPCEHSPETFTSSLRLMRGIKAAQAPSARPQILVLAPFHSGHGDPDIETLGPRSYLTGFRCKPASHIWRIKLPVAGIPVYDWGIVPCSCFIGGDGILPEKWDRDHIFNMTWLVASYTISVIGYLLTLLFIMEPSRNLHHGLKVLLCLISLLAPKWGSLGAALDLGEFSNTCRCFSFSFTCPLHSWLWSLQPRMAVMTENWSHECCGNSVALKMETHSGHLLVSQVLPTYKLQVYI